MENQLSNLTWAFIGSRPTDPEKPITQEELQKMLSEAFLPDKLYKLFLCGAEVEDKPATLQEMEDGYYLVKAGMPEMEHGDYCIISSHEEGNLLFMAIESDNDLFQNAQNISGDLNPMWPEGTASA